MEPVIVMDGHLINDKASTNHVSYRLFCQYVHNQHTLDKEAERAHRGMFVLTNAYRQWCNKAQTGTF